jgi:hypothetical protein
MYSIFSNSEDKGHSFDSFYEKFFEVCKQHKAQDRALAFAFILYDFGDAHLNKIINDEEYWLSLNAVSGKYLTVFSIHYSPKAKRRAVRNPKAIEYFTMISNFDNPSESSNKLIEKFFGTGLTVNYPAVMFFQIADDHVLDYTLVQLEKTRIEESFEELKNYISKAVEALKGVAPEYKGNHTEIFALLKDAVKGERTKIVARKAIKTATSIAELGSTLMGLK